MGLESATFISQLVSTNPIGTDDRSTADDHMRLIKSVLQATFPNATAAINATPTEFNILAGAVVTTAEFNRLQSIAGTINRALVTDGSGNIVESLVTTTELDTLDGITATTAELNRTTDLSGTINRVAIINAAGNLTESLVTTTELDLLDGLLASTAELNTMNGILSTTAELNRLSDFVGTANRAIEVNGSGQIVASLVTLAELNKLDGLTATTTEMNFLVGVLGAIIDTQGGQTIANLIITNNFTTNGELILNAGYSEDADATIPGGPITLDTAIATYFHTPTLTSAPTFTFSNPAASGRVTSFTLELSNAGTFAPIWPASVDWPAGLEPAWTAGIDIATFWTRNAGGLWHGSAATLDSK